MTRSRLQRWERRPPRRPWWQSLLIAVLGSLLPFLLVAWAGSTANHIEAARWQEDWDELEGVAAGPVVEDDGVPRMPVRVPTPGGNTVERRLPVAQMRPDPDAWQAILAADGGDVVPLARSRHQPDTIVVSPHFSPLPLRPWLAAGVLLGFANGAVLALVYRRRHRL